MKIYFETIVEKELKSVKDGFNEELFRALKPWWVPASLKEFGMEKDDLVVLEFPLRQRWISKLTEVDDSSDSYFQFIDEGIELPFPLVSWRHRHRLEKVKVEDSFSGTKIIDHIEFSAANKVISLFIYPLLWYSFKVREPIYCERFSKNT